MRMFMHLQSTLLLNFRCFFFSLFFMCVYFLVVVSPLCSGLLQVKCNVLRSTPLYLNADVNVIVFPSFTRIKLLLHDAKSDRKTQKTKSFDQDIFLYALKPWLLFWHGIVKEKIDLRI